MLDTPDQPAFIPRSALIFGLAGALPVYGSVIGYFFGTYLFGPGMFSILLDYGAVILSFIGGAHWGFAARLPDGNSADATLLYARSVIPSLAGWTIAIMPAEVIPQACYAMAVLFLAVLPLDFWARAKGFAPVWWPKLRVILSSMMAAGFALLGFIA